MVRENNGARAMRIAHVTHTFTPYQGGTGRVCLHNALELARLGHDVHVFTAIVPNAPSHQFLDGVEVHRLRPLVRIGNAPVLPGLMQALRGFDIIHLHYPFFGGEHTALAARLYRTPLVVTYHQDVLLRGAMGMLAGILQRTIGRVALRSATRLLFTSSDYGAVSTARPMMRGRESAIGELPNGVDYEFFAAPRVTEDFRARLGLPQHARIALLVAGLDRAHYFKGVEVFIAALAQTSPEVYAVVVGDGDLRSVYEAEVSKLGLSGRVVFAGYVPDEDLPVYYQLADVTVLPSLTMGEAFGLVLIESMAGATPVIATELPGVRSVVSHGLDGFLVPPGNATALAMALREMLSDEVRRVEMGQQGQRKVRARYAWTQLGAQLEAIYHQVMQREAGHARPLTDGT